MPETLTEVCLCLKAGGISQSCDITVEPLSRSQQRLADSVEVRVRGVLQNWNSSSLAQTSTESWVLQCSSSRAEDFRGLLLELSARALHMVRLLYCHRVQSDSYTLQFSLFDSLLWGSSCVNLCGHRRLCVSGDVGWVISPFVRTLDGGGQEQNQQVVQCLFCVRDVVFLSVSSPR